RLEVRGPAGERLGVLDLSPALVERGLEVSEPRRLAFELLSGRVHRELALGELGITPGKLLFTARDINGRGSGEGPGPPLALALELALRRFELALALPGPLGCVAERRLHPRDLARGGLLHPVALGGKIPLELLQTEPFRLQRLDRRLRVGLDRHRPRIR